MRVSEFAKELGKTSKEVLDILRKHNIELTHSSNISEENVQVVKKAMGGGRQAGPRPSQTALGGGQEKSQSAGPRPRRNRRKRRSRQCIGPRILRP